MKFGQSPCEFQLDFHSLL